MSLLDSCSPLRAFTPGAPSVCTVCGDTATGNHFGVQSCEGCKGFFRRSVRSSQRYECRKRRNCTIDRVTRTRCRCCRLQKCFAVGMKKEAVQVLHIVRDTSTGMRKLRAESPRLLDEVGKAVAVYLRSNVTDDAPPPLSHPAVNAAGQLDYSRRLPSPSAAYTSAYDTFQALMNAEMLLHESDSLEIIVPVDRPVTLDDGFEGLKCCFLSVMEWVHCIPEFVRLDMDSKNRLIQSCWCDLCTLQFATRNRQTSSALVLANGLSFRYDQIQGVAFQEIVDRTRNEVTSWLESMTIDEVEIAHIKALLLFNSEDNNVLSPDSRALIQHFQDQIMLSLNSYLQHQYPFLPLRFSQILMHIGSIKLVSLVWQKYAKLEQLNSCDTVLSELFNFVR